MSSMKRLSQLCQRLESVPFNRSKAEILAEYLGEAPERDIGWALYLLLGGQLERLLSPAQLESWARERSGLPEWLWKECRERSGDLAEAVALISELGGREERASDLPELGLADWIERELGPQAHLDSRLSRWWRELPIDVSWAVHALAIGRFPVHVSRRAAEDAIELAAQALGCQPGGAAGWLDARLSALPIRSPQPPVAQLSLF
jgi:DNA ligase-1